MKADSLRVSRNLRPLNSAAMTRIECLMEGYLMRYMVCQIAGRGLLRVPDASGSRRGRDAVASGLAIRPAIGLANGLSAALVAKPLAVLPSAGCSDRSNRSWGALASISGWPPMAADADRPQWLSVPAAPAQALGARARMGRGRLLTITADHGVAHSLPRVRSGCLPRPDGSAHGVAPRQECLVQPGRLTRDIERWPWPDSLSCLGFNTNADLEMAEGGEPRAEGRGDWLGEMSEETIDLGRHDPTTADPAAQRFELGPGTADSRLGAAMDGHRLDIALSAGRHAVERAKLDGVALIWAQGYGVGSAITNQAWRQPLMSATPACAREILQSCGDVRFMPDAPDLAPFALPEAIHIQCLWREVEGADARRLLRRHAAALTDPYAALRCLGGFEHAALVGSALAAAQLGLAWRAWGASACIALLLALQLNPSTRPWLHPASALT
jgi:hypothetical protein